MPAITWSKSVNAFWEKNYNGYVFGILPGPWKKNKLTSKKVYKPIPSIWPTFLQIHPRELLKLHFDMLLSFSLILLILQRLLWFLWISIWSFFFFSRQKFLIKDQFEFGMNPHEVLECFRRYSKIILDSDRLPDSFRESKHVLILRKKVQKDSANDYAGKYILAL